MELNEIANTENQSTIIKKLLDGFDSDPFAVLDQLLKGSIYLDELEGSEANVVFIYLFDSANKDLQVKLDDVMCKWFYKYLEERPTNIPLPRWNEILKEAFLIVTNVYLQKTQTWLHDHYEHIRTELQRLYINMSSDPEIYLLRALATRQLGDSLTSLWLDFCQLKDFFEIYDNNDRTMRLACIGLLGLENRPGEFGSMDSDIPKKLFEGFVSLANAIGNQKNNLKARENIWMLEFNSFRSRYPRSDEYWQTHFGKHIKKESGGTADKWINKSLGVKIGVNEELESSKLRHTLHTPICNYVHKETNMNSAKQIIDASLYQSKKFRVLGDIKAITFEKLFLQFINNWSEVSVCSTRSALWCLRLIDRDFIRMNKDNIHNFVNKCFDYEIGGYSDVTEVDNNYPERSSNIFSTYVATDILRMLFEQDKDEQLITNDSITKLDDKKIRLIEKFVINCIKTNKISYLVNNPRFEDTDGICVLYLADKLCWTLGKAEKFSGLFKKYDWYSYINSCKLPDSGFLSKPLHDTSNNMPFRSQEPGMADSFFAIILSDKYSEKPDSFENVNKFVNNNWNPQSGSYVNSYNSLPSIQGTYYAMRILKRLKVDIGKEKKDNIIKFLKSLFSKEHGGFSFAEGFPPSAYGTMWALCLGTTILTNKKFLDKEEEEKTKKFLHNLYSPRKGGFMGYPKEFTKAEKKCPVLNYVNEAGHKLHQGQ